MKRIAANEAIDCVVPDQKPEATKCLFFFSSKVAALHPITVFSFIHPFQTLRLLFCFVSHRSPAEVALHPHRRLLAGVQISGRGPQPPASLGSGTDRAPRLLQSRFISWLAQGEPSASAPFHLDGFKPRLPPKSIVFNNGKASFFAKGTLIDRSISLQFE
ncbi:hypothetical protein CUMW_168210 [Citrus unshiu]|uniref:Uncharacterized protein n=1 Tax=Citrus unshiu TaxID=55188 RepID=A0A2H5PUF5_CITUN|nr:hypothetical protein CUMW_168210 [Citrus unshiu]